MNFKGFMIAIAMSLCVRVMAVLLGEEPSFTTMTIIYGIICLSMQLSIMMIRLSMLIAVISTLPTERTK